MNTAIRSLGIQIFGNYTQPYFQSPSFLFSLLTLANKHGVDDRGEQKDYNQGPHLENG
ncbi:hypothetical protein [Vaccinia virus]|nr:hypothetical protein [Vaccinia virus]